MESLLIHDHTKLQLLALATDPPHALLLVGSRGSGKLTIAKAWAQLLTDTVHIHVLEPDEKGTITIDAVRSLYRSTRARQEAHHRLPAGSYRRTLLPHSSRPRFGAPDIRGGAEGDYSGCGQAPEIRRRGIPGPARLILLGTGARQRPA